MEPSGEVQYRVGRHSDRQTGKPESWQPSGPGSEKSRSPGKVQGGDHECSQ